jgi:uncharacterized protein YkwD
MCAVVVLGACGAGANEPGPTAPAPPAQVPPFQPAPAAPQANMQPATMGPQAGAPRLPAPDARQVALGNALNAYRQRRGLPALPLSRSLSYVAQVHVLDLDRSRDVRPAHCNAHSWSSAGPWSPCCYTKDHAQARCMWSKPRELTGFPGNGYEIAMTGNISGGPDRLVERWTESAAHHAVMINQGSWTAPWASMGVGVGEVHAAIWFAREVDPSP